MALELSEISKKIKEEELSGAKGRLDAILGAKKEEKPAADLGVVPKAVGPGVAPEKDAGSGKTYPSFEEAYQDRKKGLGTDADNTRVLSENPEIIEKSDSSRQKSDAWERASEDLREKIEAGSYAVAPEAVPGSSKESPIELTEIAEKSKKERDAENEKAEAALTKAREGYVAAIFAQEKAGKEEGKLTGIRAMLANLRHGFKSYEADKPRILEREAKIGGAQAEAAEASEKLKQAKDVLKEALKSYRDQAVSVKTAELNASGKPEEEIREEMEKYGKEILLATTMGEAAKIDSLKSDKQIEQMGTARKFINEKAEEFTDWYKKLPVIYVTIPGTEKRIPISTQMMVSASLTGAGITAGFMGAAPIMAACFAGQMGLRSLGGAMTTAGVEKLYKALQERSGEKKITKEFEGEFLEALKNNNDVLDDKLFEMVHGQQGAKNKRMIAAGLVGGIVGTGILATAVRQAFGWTHHGGGGGKNMAKGGFDVNKEALRMQGENELLKHLPSEAPSAEKIPGVDSSLSPRVGMPVSGDAVPGTSSAASGFEPGESLIKAGGGKAVSEILNLKIGTRGPEGAIIDYFRANPDVARVKFGWDGKADINEWAGRKAHKLWLASVEGELKNPKIIEELAKGGYSVDAEGYAKAMHHLGKGVVEIDAQGNMRLNDASFLDAPVKAPKAGLGNTGLDNARAPGPEAAAVETQTTITPGSEKFYNLQQEMETFPLPAEGRVPAINEALEQINVNLSAAEEHLNQANLPSEAKSFWQGYKEQLLTEKERLTDGLKTPEGKLPQIIKDLLPPEVIDRPNFGKIMDAGKFSDLSGARRELVDKLYLKYTGQSFEGLNKLSADARDKYLDKINSDMGKIVKSGVISVSSEDTLAHKALMWRNLGEMKYLQKIQEKFIGRLAAGFDYGYFENK